MVDNNLMMSNNNLMIVKTKLNELILTEFLFSEEKDAYILINPFIIEVGESHTLALPFLPGTRSNTFRIPLDYIVAMGDPNHFMLKFYGSMLYRSIAQSFLEREPFAGDPKDFTAYINDRLASTKQEICEKFGMMEDDAPDVPQNKVLH